MEPVDRLLHLARETIGKVRYCVAATVGAAGEANARIVGAFPLGDDWSVNFVTSASSRKADEIERNGRLTLSYQHDPEGAYVALVGRASLDADPQSKRACWTGALDEWFPAGPGDPDAVLVRFRTERIELWNYARGVMPAPRGLRAAVVVRGDDDRWRTVQA